MKFIVGALVTAVLVSIATVAIGNALGVEVPLWSFVIAVGSAVIGGVIGTKAAQKYDSE